MDLPQIAAIIFILVVTATIVVYTVIEHVPELIEWNKDMFKEDCPTILSLDEQYALVEDDNINI